MEHLRSSHFEGLNDHLDTFTNLLIYDYSLVSSGGLGYGSRQLIRKVNAKNIRWSSRGQFEKEKQNYIGTAEKSPIYFQIIQAPHQIESSSHGNQVLE